ncbi:SixA phosphatase family protein [Seohaeicola zhoushanensis]|uniref:Phosphoglycerate mutase n=1 Tax=Seohaeicola zhoushanensis TaxID=1569283 RepID=A0A8J3M9R5_9RHOB|nr:histidine phosphatase family protein [Seohaeicola zhoushanensis]GHF63258.1 phosphoglycerate mutase [Seohaeicola zhoushanensis]
MKTLILMRHTKSDWSTGATSDHARPLNKRGTASAAALGDWLRARGWLPDEVLCSTATRTRETLAGLRLDASVRYLDELYHADPDTMLAALHDATGDTVLMLGHNPGIAECAGLLVRAPPADDRFHSYPTGATLVARFPVDNWSAVTWGSGEVADFIVPRDLTD